MNKLVFIVITVVSILFISCNSHTGGETGYNDSDTTYANDSDVDDNVEISLRKSYDGWYKEYRNKLNGHIIRRKYQPTKEEMEAYYVQEAVQYRKNFRFVMESSKPLTLPYKLRMDIRALNEAPSCQTSESDSIWRELMFYIDEHMSLPSKKSFTLCNRLVGYLQDTSKYFTLLARENMTEENISYIITFDKNFELISSQCMYNHSSWEIVEDVLIDENYFTIDEGMKIHYYFHIKTHYEDEEISVKYDREEEYENHGYIDENGVIVYDTKNEVKLKWQNNAIENYFDRELKLPLSNYRSMPVVASFSDTIVNNFLNSDSLDRNISSSPEFFEIYSIIPLRWGVCGSPETFIFKPKIGLIGFVPLHSDFHCLILKTEDLDALKFDLWVMSKRKNIVSDHLCVYYGYKSFPKEGSDIGFEVVKSEILANKRILWVHNDRGLITKKELELGPDGHFLQISSTTEGEYEY